MSARDQRRIQANKAIAEHQMVKKTICKKTGKVQVKLDVSVYVIFGVVVLRYAW